LGWCRGFGLVHADRFPTFGGESFDGVDGADQYHDAGCESGGEHGDDDREDGSKKYAAEVADEAEPFIGGILVGPPAGYV
jgi:hypothetical protein